jgi:hypothetical protein
MRMKWSFFLVDKHLEKIFKVEILHSNKDGICNVFMLQTSCYREAGQCLPFTLGPRFNP